MGRLIPICALVLLTGCGSRDALLEAAQATVREQLRDPNSAEFRKLVHRGNFVCGEVNGKSGFGGYVGFERFSYDVRNGRVLFGTIVDDHCRSDEELAQRADLRERVKDLDKRLCADIADEAEKRRCIELMDRR